MPWGILINIKQDHLAYHYKQAIFQHNLHQEKKQPSILALLWILLQKLPYTGHEIRTILKSSTFSLLPAVLMSHSPRPPPQICSGLSQKRTRRHLRGSVRLQLHVCPHSNVTAKEQTILVEGWSTGSPRKR